MRQAADRFGETDFDMDLFFRADLGMHSEWFRTLGLEFLWKRLSSPNSSYTRFCMLDIMAGRNIPEVLGEHGEMLRLIEEGSTEGIEALLKRHLYGGIRRLGPQIYTDYAAYFEPFDDGNQVIF